MWEEIESHFTGLPAQQKVAKLLFERGFQVKASKKIVSGEIEISYTQIADEAHVGRRAVVSTVNLILSDPKLTKIFSKLRQVSLLHEVAGELGMSAIGIIPESAREKGIIATVTKILSDKGFNILQVFAEHPDMSKEPGVIIVVAGDISSELIDRLRKLSRVRRVTLY